MGCVAQYQSSAAEAARPAIERDACVLLQVQRPAVRQGREARHHGAPCGREQRRCASERAKGVSTSGGAAQRPANMCLRYASEVDVDFVRRSIKAIGQTAIKIDEAAERCVNVLLELIGTRVSYVVQEAVVVMKVSRASLAVIAPSGISSLRQDIFRKYPSTYEGVIPTLCANLDELDEPEAKASLIWIIGEYANKIDNADELLAIFVDTFTEESYPVRDGCPCVFVIPTRTEMHRCNCKR